MYFHFVKRICCKDHLLRMFGVILAVIISTDSILILFDSIRDALSLFIFTNYNYGQVR